jgi:hypothetical protein
VAELGDHSVPTSVEAPQDVARRKAPQRLALPISVILVHAALVHAEPVQRSQLVAQMHPHPTTRWVLHS